MPKKRTTVTASRDSLSTLEAEAARRGVALTVVLAEGRGREGRASSRVAATTLGARALERRPLGRRRDGRPGLSSTLIVALVLDTGPLLAALDAAEPDHGACARLLTDATEDLVVPGLVLAELDYWCHERLDADVWLAFLDDLLEGAYRAEHPTDHDLRRCRALQAQYGDVGLGVVDASVLALVERLDEDKVATLDRRHFAVVRPAHIAALDLVP
jgi:predicted nucleic acid-binding protein